VSDSPTALGDITVIDLSPMMPGHFCSMILGDLGARVVKIERPEVGDFSRRTVAGSFESVNRNKQSLTLDLKNPEAQQVLHRLVAKADVVIEGFRPGVVRRLAADYETLRTVTPDLIYCAISGYGQVGPYRDLPGHDPNYLAVAGVLSLAGDPTGPPVGVVGASMADLSGAWFAAIAILAALRARDVHGVGQYIDIALADASYALMQSRLVEYLLNGRPSKAKLMARPGVGLFETRDHRYITVGAVEDHFWLSLCDVLEIAEWGHTERMRTSAQRRELDLEIQKRLQTAFRKRTCEEWILKLRAVGVPCAAVNDPGEAANDPHAQAREIIEWQDHPVLRRVPQIRFPAIMSATPAVMRSRAPLLSEHTDEILKEVGYNDDQVAMLHRSGAV
jgi:crotonobetainyl-CoA:carnitine CoA-transferase CaiB-like acyl-CoA transferase